MPNHLDVGTTPSEAGKIVDELQHEIPPERIDLRFLNIVARIRIVDPDVFIQQIQGLTFNINQYSLNPDLSQNYLNRTVYAEFSYNLNDAWRVTTALDYRLYAKEVFGTGQNIPLWRAELSRSFFQDKAQLKLVALDLLAFQQEL